MKNFDSKAWLENLYLIEGIDNRIDTILDCHETLCVENKFDTFDVIMQQVDFNRLDLSSIYCFIGITNMIRHEFKHWNDYRDRFRDHLISIGKDQNRFLNFYHDDKVENLG